MKKTTLYLAMAALAFASCSKNEVSEGLPIANDPSKISFNSSTGTTRAVDNGLTQVQAGFNVLGYVTEGAGTAVYIAGTDAESTYKFTTPNWGWEKTDGWAWPEDDAKYPMTFYAEYPKTDMSVIGTAGLKRAITIPLDLTGADGQKDILAASATSTTRPSSGFEQLQFKHILSNIVFKIQTRADYKVFIQSIRVVNTAMNGRSFNYKTMAYEAEPTYTTANLAATDGTYDAAKGFFYANNTTTAWSNTAVLGAAEVVPATNSELMMQMPQMDISYWIDEVSKPLATFKADAEKWNKGNEVDKAAKLGAWYTADPTTANQSGMMGSKGWEGARIEVIYRIFDTKSNKSVIGRADGESYAVNGAPAAVVAGDRYVRAGFPLNLSEIKVESTSKGWEMNKRYTYTIQLGTTSATNGILLDPDYKGLDGASVTPKTEIENPATGITPGQPVTPGTINFSVGVDQWTDATGIDIK